MSIIGSLPDNLTNGTTADASQVMADLNFIVNQVNANATPLGTLAAPSGTRVPFNQASAPAGWVTDATLNDNVMWISAGAGGVNSSAAQLFSSFINGAWTSGGTAISTAQLPPHSHPVSDPGHTHGVNDPGHSHTFYPTGANGGSTGFTLSGFPTSPQVTGTSGTGISIQTSGTGVGTLNTGSGAAHTHPMNTSWNFAGHIIAQKS